MLKYKDIIIEVVEIIYFVYILNLERNILLKFYFNRFFNNCFVYLKVCCLFFDYYLYVSKYLILKFICVCINILLMIKVMYI